MVDAVLKISTADFDTEIIRGDTLMRQGHPADPLSVLPRPANDAPDNALARYYLNLAYAANSNFALGE